MSELDLTGIPSEGDPIDQEGQQDAQETTPAESSPEDQETETAPSSQGAEETADDTVADSNTVDDTNLPFDKNPKVQDYISRQVDKRLADTMQEVAQGQKQIVEAMTAGKPTPPEPIPTWFSNLYATGDPEQDQTNWKSYKEAQVQQTAEIRESVKQEILGEQQFYQQTISKAEQDLNAQFGEMKADGLKFDENAVRKFLVDYQTKYGALPRMEHPDYPEGLIDIRKGYELMQQLKGQSNQPKADARKAIAAQADSEQSVVDTDNAGQIPVGKRSWFGYK